MTRAPEAGRRICARWLEVLAGLALFVLLPVLSACEEHFASEPALIEHLLALIDERLALMPAVAAWKWRERTGITDPAREQAVTERAAQLGRALGLAEAGVRQLFELEVRLARESEQRLHTRWHEHGFDYAGPVADLGATLRPQLDRLTNEQLRALELARPVLESPPFAGRYAGQLASHLPGERWSEASRAQLLAALARLRAVDSAALERVTTAGVLRVGTTGDYAPFSVEGPDGVLAGADIALAKSLARQLGVTAVFIRTSWPTLLDDLRAQNFDLALGGVSVTAARLAVAAFSIPYAASGKASIARCSDARRYPTLAAIDRRGVRVIVNPGGTNQQFVQENLRHAKIVVFADNRTIFEEIRAGRADVMITDDVEVALQAHRHADLCATLRSSLTHADKAILLPRDPAFIDAVNRELAVSIARGEPARMLGQALGR
ncbi:MAG TPA: transporter substrate-binding domain-containing protein [Steroidobacteraceae bacterium]